MRRKDTAGIKGPVDNKGTVDNVIPAQLPKDIKRL